jgi:hydroxymethylpyrimidine pyrophosphatase-like HAD family hydrolase
LPSAERGEKQGMAEMSGSRSNPQPGSKSYVAAAARFDAVICDIDGCIAPEASIPMDAALLAELAAWNRAAAERRDRPLVTYCSGRPEPFVEAICRLTASQDLPAVAENGVWLFHPASNGWDRDPAITVDHLRAVQGAREWIEGEFGQRGVVLQPGKAASLSLYHPDTEYLRTLPPRLVERFGREKWPLRVSMTWLYINCDLVHISKGTGIDRLIAAAGLDRVRLAGIGDTPSDIAIAERVSYFACPANADEALKLRADYVSPRPEVAGVLDILERLTGAR